MSDKSVGQWVGAIVGAVVGFFVPAVGVPLGYAIGTALGGYVDPPKGPTIEGPRLQDLNVQIASLGAPMGRIYGTVGLHGNVIWVEGNEIREVVRKQKQGGKGGGGSTVKTYSYFGTFAVALCEGPVDGIRRVWIGNDLVYNSGSTQLGTIIASNSAFKNLGFFDKMGYFLTGQGNKGISFAFYRGTHDQDVDPRIEADLGVGRTPAFRGTAYIVFYDLPLERYGNTLLGAQVKVEAVRNGSPVQPCETAVEWSEPLEGVDATIVTPASIAVIGGRLYHIDPAGEIQIRSTDGASLGVAPYPMTGFSRVRAAVNNPFVQLIRATSGDDAGRVFIKNAAGEPGLGPLRSSTGEYMGGAPRGGQVVQVPGTNQFIVLEQEIGGAQRKLIARYNGQNFPEEEITAPWESITNDHTGTVAYSGGYFWLINDSRYLIRYDAAELADVMTWDVINNIYAQSFGIIGDIAYIQTGLSGHTTRVFQLNDDGSATQLCTIPGGRAVANVDDTVVVTIGGTHARFFSPGIERGGYEILGNVVRDELERSELIQAGDIDSSELLDEVRGYRIAGVQQIRSVLSPLQGAYPFDIIPSGYQIKAVRRGKSSVKTIALEELDARAYGSEAQTMLEQAREMDSQLPRRVTLRYLDASREYEINEQYSPERQSSQAVNIREFEMPLVLSADQAAGVAEVLQYVPWLERTPMQFRLGPEHLDLEPADVITIDAPYGQFPVRLDSIKYGPNGVLECTARPNAPAIWTPNAEGGEGVIPDGEVGLAADTVIELMDIPLIRDADDQPGFAAAMAGTSDGWEGGVLFRSVDNGQTWQDIQAWAAPVTMGYARNALAAHDGYVIDRDSELQVDLTAGALESITEAQMMTGLHWVAYGADQRWELIRFADADLQPDGSYVLSTLIRGARGTEWATSLHQPGDAVVLLDDADVAGILTSIETLNLVMQWRGVSVGQDINEAQNVPFAYRGVNLKPLSAVHPVGNRTGGNWLISATRRSRYTTSWWTTGIERPLGEAVQAWEIDILDGAEVVRTLTGSSLPITYTSAEQTEDFGQPILEFDAVIYQMSATVGRGYPLAATFADTTVPYETVVLNDNPIGYWRMNESSGPAAIDYSGNGHDGTYSGGPALQQPALAGDGASVLFDGTDDCLSLPINAVGASFSVEFWTDASAMSDRYLWAEGRSTDSMNYYCGLASGNGSNWATSAIRIAARTTTNINHATPSGVLNGSILHVVLTYDGTTARLYINGAQRASGAVPYTSITPNTSTLGALVRTSVSSYASGRFAELAYYDYALSQARILAHYNAGKL